jgi:hypothetical protein
MRKIPPIVYKPGSLNTYSAPGEMDAKDLYKFVSDGYRENELAFEHKHKGSEFTVSGIIKSIGKTTFSNHPIVTLDAGTLSFIQCEFLDSAMDQLIEYKKGDQFRCIGVLRNKMITSVFLDKCTIQ